jgi:hypothetical protein
MNTFVGILISAAAGTLSLIGILAIGLGIVALIKPLPKLRLGVRWRSATLLIVGLVIAAIGGNVAEYQKAKQEGYASVEEMRSAQKALAEKKAMQAKIDVLVEKFPGLAEKPWAFKESRVMLACFDDTGPNAIVRSESSKKIFALNGLAMRHYEDASEIIEPNTSVGHLIEVANYLCGDAERQRQWLSLEYNDETSSISANIYEDGFKTDREVALEKIEEQFSPYDGSHYNLERLVKASMNDPDSYDHVETVYWVMVDHLVVRTTFRGNNAFGGKVTQSVKAKISFDGDVIDVFE